MLLKYKIKSKNELFEIISKLKKEEVEAFKNQLIKFLNSSFT
jgi:hypothetical protein